MKKFLILVPTIILSGCLTTPVVVDTKWPDAPQDLKTQCPDLKLLDAADNKLSSMVSTIGDNYTEYNLCKNRVDGWNEWYNEQKKIKESIKK